MLYSTTEKAIRKTGSKIFVVTYMTHNSQVYVPSICHLTEDSQSSMKSERAPTMEMSSMKFGGGGVGGVSHFTELNTTGNLG